MNLRFKTLIGLAFSIALPAVIIAGEKDFHDQDLKGKVFDNQALNGANFADAILRDASFQKASLKKASFKGADLHLCNFNGADLTEADFREVPEMPYISGATFFKANMEGGKLGVTYGTSYRSALLSKATIEGVAGGNDFSNADLRGANLRGLHLAQPPCRFRNAIYDEDTAWPEGFDPVAAGAVLAKPEAKAEVKAEAKPEEKK